MLYAYSLDILWHILVKLVWAVNVILIKAAYLSELEVKRRFHQEINVLESLDLLQRVGPAGGVG